MDRGKRNKLYLPRRFNNTQKTAFKVYHAHTSNKSH